MPAPDPLIPLRQHQLDPHSTAESGAEDVETTESSSSVSPVLMDNDGNNRNGSEDPQPDTRPAETAPSHAPPTSSQEPNRRSVKDLDEKSEFEDDDKIKYFELWSSDATSPNEENISDHNSSTKKKNRNWTDSIKKENIMNLDFTGNASIQLDTGRKYSALECFKFFVDDDLIKLMVTETNRNARANFVRYGYHEGFLSGWLDVDYREMTQFLGIIIFMAFKRLPDTASYWSTERLYFNSVACRVFTQTRFHRILAFWHFGTDGTDSVYAKVNPVINRLNENFKKYKQPGNILYIGKSTVYLRNKFILESIPLGAAKRGSKILKVMDQDIYTYKLKILSPETGPTRINITKGNVFDLLDGFLDEGRLLIFHNLYMSVDLAEELLKRKCHSIGMIRKNARGTPKELDNKSLQDGELIGFQSDQGISVMKWQSLGAPYWGITSCHTLETVPRVWSTSSTEGGQVYKYLRDIALSEKVFEAKEKFSINTSPLNEQLKWYQRIACDAIINTATINALVLYKKINKEKIKMWDFRDKLFRELVDIKQLPTISSDEETEEPELEEQ